MYVSTTLENLDMRFGRAEAIRMVAEAGFTAFDMALFHMADPADELCGDNWRELAVSYRRLADELGIVCNQAHAPFPSSFADDRQTEARFELIVRSMEIAAIMGAKSIVVHPVQHLPYIRHIDGLKEMNRAFYARLLPYAEKFGINIATENMWQVMKMWMDGGWADGELPHNPIVDSTCASGEEFAAYVDMMESDRMVACLDIGHAKLVQREPADMIRALGSRLRALHIHDVDGQRDLHTIPFVSVGTVDFDAVTTALAEIGYADDITFETGTFFIRIPDALVPSALRFLCEVGNYLAAEVERKKG